jgi:hypothetical protein
MKVDGIFKELESLVRYVAPGFTLLTLGVLAGHDYSSVLESSYTLVILPFLGIAWYALHRTLFNILDYPIYWALGHKIALSYDKNLAPDSKKNRGYLYARLANIHLSIIIAEQSLVVSGFSKANGCYLFWCGLIAILMSVASYIMTSHEIGKYDERSPSS